MGEKRESSLLLDLAFCVPFGRRKKDCLFVILFLFYVIFFLFLLLFEGLQAQKKVFSCPYFFFDNKIFLFRPLIFL